MPNHCSNKLTISGPAKDVKSFVAFAKGKSPAWGEEKPDKRVSKLQLHKFAPVPVDVIKAGYSNTGYEWCIQNWGTKWGCYDTEVRSGKPDKKGNKTVIYTFHTAWSPFNPEVLEAMSEKFPTLKLELMYAEQGCCYHGRTIAIGGKITSDEYQEGVQVYADEEVDGDLVYIGPSEYEDLYTTSG